MKLSHLLRLETVSVELEIFVSDNFRYFLEISENWNVYYQSTVFLKHAFCAYMVFTCVHFLRTCVHFMRTCVHFMHTCVPFPDQLEPSSSVFGLKQLFLFLSLFCE